MNARPAHEPALQWEMQKQGELEWWHATVGGYWDGRYCVGVWLNAGGGRMPFAEGATMNAEFNGVAVEPGSTYPTLEAAKAACQRHRDAHSRPPDLRTNEDDFEYRVGLLEAQPGDVVLLKLTKPCERDVVMQIHRSARNLFPHQRVVVLDHGMEISILSRSEAPPTVLTSKLRGVVEGETFDSAALKDLLWEAIHDIERLSAERDEKKTKTAERAQNDDDPDNDAGGAERNDGHGGVQVPPDGTR